MLFFLSFPSLVHIQVAVPYTMFSSLLPLNGWINGKFEWGIGQVSSSKSIIQTGGWRHEEVYLLNWPFTEPGVGDAIQRNKREIGLILRLHSVASD